LGHLSLQIGIAHPYHPGEIFYSFWFIVIITFLYFVRILTQRHSIPTHVPRVHLTTYQIPSLLSAPYSTEGAIPTVDCQVSPTSTNPYFNHTQQMVYLSGSTGMPIVFDTGASASVTPIRDDFVGDLIKPPYSCLKGLKGSINVVGAGHVDWTIFDVHGVTRTIRTQALYIPEGNIRLFSPQCYFQEQKKGKAEINKSTLSLSLADGTTLEFPFAHGCNLPIMLSKLERQPSIGLSYDDIKGLMISASAYVTVADETNQNLTSSQRELLLWHWRLGHANMQWIQMLAVRPKEDSVSALLLTKQTTVSSCPLPLCMACQMAKQTRRSPPGTRHIFDSSREMLTKRNNILPGQMVSVDQYIGFAPGRLPNTKGKELLKDKYTGGTIFVDHASGFVFVRNQVSLRVGETLISKKMFEGVSRQYGVRIGSYFGDNFPFNSEEFKADIRNKNQTLVLSGVGAHHQNGVAERAIKTVTSFARAMLLHATFHWPAQADLTLWPFALDYAVFIWNHLPNRISRLAPIEIFSRTCTGTVETLQRCRVWGCPVYVLAPELQDGKKIPKWHPRSRRGMFMGFSTAHSSTVGKVLNIATGFVSPQYHVVYDELFTTVGTDSLREEASPHRMFPLDTWMKIIQTGYDRFEDLDDETSLDHLSQSFNDWLTPQEVDSRMSLRDTRRTALRIRSATDTTAQDQSTQKHFRDTHVTEISPSRSILGESTPHTSSPLRLDFDNVPDDVQSPIDSLHPPEDVQHINTDNAVRRGSRVRSKNPKYFNDDKWINYQTGQFTRQKIRLGVLNDLYLHCLQWDLDTNTTIISNDYATFLGASDIHQDYDEGTVEYQHPLILQMKANSDDNPTWDEAMNGPDQAGYWKAMEKELHTLEEKMDSWDVVSRESWMNVLPSTWAFKCKRYPDGNIRKLKARFCVRGDRQKEGIDYFDTFAPVVSWPTVRLMLILSVILNLSTKQVDYTAAFVHAPIDKSPLYDTMTDDEKEKSGVYVAMPRGFIQQGKVLRLKKSLYGLKQAPRNFFLHLKAKLESIGFVSQVDLDPCLFITDKVICLVYVDDTLFYASKAEYIDQVIQQIKDSDMDLEVEGEVAGFLGVHMHRDDNQHTITLTQTGLIKRIIEAVGVTHLPPKCTPADHVPLVKDTNGDPVNGTFNYSSVIGMLQYLQNHTRPDITYAVSQCARFVHFPRKSHEDAVIRICQYLKGTSEQGLILQPSTTLKIDCFVDADFAGLWPHEDRNDPTCVKSRTGFVIKLSNCPVIWGSKLQGSIALSTMEAEYLALSSTMRELIPFKELVTAVGNAVGFTSNEITTIRTTVWEDNVGAWTLANLEPGRSTPRSKHYAIRTHWFRGKLKPTNTEVCQISSDEQDADIMTKGLRIDPYRKNRKRFSGW
jgi:Reverse transcriptase (RNA-dependent DNA polymerase)